MKNMTMEERKIAVDAHFEEIGKAASVVLTQANYIRDKSCNYTGSMMDSLVVNVGIIQYLLDNIKKL